MPRADRVYWRHFLPTSAVTSWSCRERDPAQWQEAAGRVVEVQETKLSELLHHGAFCSQLCRARGWGAPGSCQRSESRMQPAPEAKETCANIGPFAQLFPELLHDPLQTARRVCECSGPAASWLGVLLLSVMPVGSCNRREGIPPAPQGWCSVSRDRPSASGRALGGHRVLGAHP